MPTRSFPVSPSTDVFGDILLDRIAAGESFVDPSRFAADSEWSATLRVLPYLTLRLAVVACEYFKPTYCLTAIKPEHSAFYQRIFRVRTGGRAEILPGPDGAGVSLPVKCADNLQSTIERFPFFNSTAYEQRLLFSRPQRGELAPLTILPTAKYLQDAA